MLKTNIKRNNYIDKEIRIKPVPPVINIEELFSIFFINY